MQTKHLCVLIHIWTKGEVGAPLNRFKPSSKIFLLTVPRRCFICGSFMFLSVLFCYAFMHVSWSPAGKGLTFGLSFVKFNCDVVTFPLVSWVRCGVWLYRFLIFALFLTWTWTNGILSSKIYDKRDGFNISHFLMEMLLAPLPIMYIVRSLFDLRE